MGSYVQQALINDEKVAHDANVSLWSLSGLILIGLLLLPMGIGLIFWISALIAYKTTELAITDKRVVAKTGLIRRDTIEMDISKVESIQVEQSILGRILNYGSVVVSGAGNPQAPIKGISDPLLFRKKFFELKDSIS